MAIRITKFGRKVEAFANAFSLSKSDICLITIYALAFLLLHISALPWGHAGHFSLWYPAAGLRFAVLWHWGPRLTPWLMAAELAMYWASGSIPYAGLTALHASLSILRPGFAYGLSIFATRRLIKSHNETQIFAPMPLCLAVISGPVLSAVLVRLVAMISPNVLMLHGVLIQDVRALTVLVVGDLLGILVIAPPLLWAVGVMNGSIPLRLSLPQIRPTVEDALVLTGCLCFTVTLSKSGFGIQSMPSLLAGAWIGIRHGKTIAWFAIIAELALFLPHTAEKMHQADRVELHMGIAAMVIVTWLSGSFSDGQKAAREALDRRNRLLFQAERLKTLRAMSVAVIHEISQPLSTLAIEASHLKDVTSGLDPEIAQSADLVDRKARTLTEMVRRLRRFGGRDADKPSALLVRALVQTAEDIVTPELRAASCRLDVQGGALDLFVCGQEVELTQALVNLIRNAITATADGRVKIVSEQRGDVIEIAVTNATSMSVASGSGMGVGLIIARTILEAHGGTLKRESGDGTICFILSVPVAQD